MNEPEVANMVCAAELYGMAPILRVPTNSPHVILRYLDLGVTGVVIPHVDSKKDAEQAVEAAKYYPLGKRGSNYGSGRNNNYGTGMQDVREYYEESNRETMVIALKEISRGEAARQLNVSQRSLKRYIELWPGHVPSSGVRVRHPVDVV